MDSERTAGANGPLPDLRFEFVPRQPESADIGHHLYAYAGDENVGHMAIGHPWGTILGLDVEPEWQRRGIATALWQEAERLGLRPAHDWSDITDEAEAWANSMGHTRPQYDTDGNRISMAMPQEEWNQFLSQPGAYLYHSTHRSNLPSILQHGLMPRDQAMNAGMEGQFYPWGDASQPRPGHIYFATTPKETWTGPNDVTLAIPAKHLDPNLISMDEDQARLEIPSRAPQGESFGPWIEQNYGDYMRRPENTLTSWNNGTVAYKGSIPPEHIQVMGQPQQQVAKTAASGRWWHLTDKPKFELDPTYFPENNTTLGGDWHEPGIFLTQRPEQWHQGHDYVRPFVAELEADPRDIGGYSGEHFLPASAFEQARVKRVIPYDAYVGEQFEDTPYTGPDVREMTPEQHQEWFDRTNDYIRNNRAHMLSYPCSHCGAPGEQWNECQSCGQLEDPSYDAYQTRGYMPQFKGQGDFYKRAGADHDGAMVAIFVPKEAQGALHQRGGEPKRDLHITLAYFTDKAKDRDDWDKAKRVVEEVAHRFGPLEVTIGGLGFFDGHDGERPMIGTVDCPGLAELHLALKDALNGEDFPVSDEHGYSPHVTLEYTDQKDTEVPDVKLPVTFPATAITLVIGGERSNVSLEGDHKVSLRSVSSITPSPQVVTIIDREGYVKTAAPSKHELMREQHRKRKFVTTLEEHQRRSKAKGKVIPFPRRPKASEWHTAADEWVPSVGLTFHVGDRVMTPNREMGTIIEIDPPAPDDYDDNGEPVGETIWTRVKLDSGQVVKAAADALMFVGGMDPAPARIPATRETHPGPDEPWQIDQMVRNAAIDPDWLAQYIQAHGPYLYHSTEPKAVQHILAEGLYPWDASDLPDEYSGDWVPGTREDNLGPLMFDQWGNVENRPHTTYEGRMQPRSGRVYIGDRPTVMRYGRPYIKVDLRKLDPMKIGSDEDYFDTVMQRPMIDPQDAANTVGAGRVDPVPPIWDESGDTTCPDCGGSGTVNNTPDGMCPTCQGMGRYNWMEHGEQPETLGEWANRHAAVLDHPRITPHSLGQGSISYEGTIPPEAMSFNNDFLHDFERDPQQQEFLKQRAAAVGDGDGWTTCDQGHMHWGQHGAAGLLIRHVDPQGQSHYLLQHRSPDVQYGGTWSVPGGALDSHETPEQGALREAQEEWGNLPVQPRGVVHTSDHGGWAYHTVLADAPEMFEPQGNWESGGHAWLTPQQIDQQTLHPGFAESWPSIRTVAKVAVQTFPGLEEHPQLVDRPYYYHAAPSSQRQRIMTYGLQPSRPGYSENWGPSPDYLLSQPEGVYVTNTPHGMPPETNEPYDIWRVPAHQIRDMQPDPMLNQWGNGFAYVIPHAVQPELHSPHEDRWMDDEERQFDPSTPPAETDWWWDLPNDETRKQLGIGFPDRVIGRHTAAVPDEENDIFLYEPRKDYAPNGSVTAQWGEKYMGAVGPDLWHAYEKISEWVEHTRQMGGKMPRIWLVDAATGFDADISEDFYRHMLNREAKTAMAEQSGDPKLDALIEAFKQEQPWLDCWNEEQPPTMEDLRRPEISSGYCGNISSQFIEFAKQHGIRASFMHLSEEPERGSVSFEGNGYDDREPGGYEDHSIVKVKLPSGTYLVDWTASQYGYTELPRVLKPNQFGIWEARTAAEEEKAPAEDSDAQAALKKATDLLAMLVKGGFTATGELEPQEPNAWMIGIAGTTIRRLMDQLGVEDILAKAQELLGLDPGYYLGGWKEVLKDQGETGYGCIEISAGVPNLAQAKQIAKDNGQDAIYHPVLDLMLVYDPATQDYVEHKEAAVTSEPRFARYHKMVSAPELWNPEGVAKAIQVLQGVEEPQQPADGQETPDEPPGNVLPLQNYQSPYGDWTEEPMLMAAKVAADWKTKYDYRKAEGKHHCGSCAAFKEGRCLMFKAPVLEDSVCDEWTKVWPEKKSSAQQIERFKYLLHGPTDQFHIWPAYGPSPMSAGPHHTDVAKEQGIENQYEDTTFGDAYVDPETQETKLRTYNVVPSSDPDRAQRAHELAQQWFTGQGHRLAEPGSYYNEKLGAQQVMYHVAPRDARDSILKHGIDHRIEDSEQEGNWLWLDHDDAKRFAGDSGTHDVWQVNGDGLSGGYETMMYPGRVQTAWWTPDPVEPHRLRLLSDERTASANTMYHVAPRSARESILANGLRPAVDLYPEEFNPQDIEYGMLGDQGHVWMHDAYPSHITPEMDSDVWEVNAEGMPLEQDNSEWDGPTTNWFKAPMKHIVPPNRLRLLSE